MVRARRRPTLASRAETIDHDLAAAVRVPAGKGHRCDRCGLREATRWVGLRNGDGWRCDTCPDPTPIVISGEIDLTQNDPRRRWPWTNSRKTTHQEAAT